jgi:chromosome segregation ATPase
MADALESVAAELYALPLGEFTQARNARATDARGNGDRELAQRIRQLKKPSTSAWAVNMLARHRADEVGQLLELGASLREAQSELDAEQLRELGRQRQKLIAAVVKQAAALAKELGDPIGSAAAEEVGQTLQAALADPDAADAVTAGVLTRPLAASGWGPVDIDASVAVPSRKRKAPVTSITEKQRTKAKRRLKDAEDDLQRRESELAKLTDALGALDTQREEVSGEIDELEARLAELEKKLATLDREHGSVQRQRDKADAAVDEAAGEVADAEAEVKRLG